MSSSLTFLAYALARPESPHITAVRTRHVEDRLAALHHSPLVRTTVGNAGSGFIGWTSPHDRVSWRPYTSDDGSGTAWLHVPGPAGGPGTAVTERGLADDLFEGRVQASDLGAPFAAIRWTEGRLQIANDMLGLVRLFHFEFPDGHVWSTRSDMAHIFMGEAPARNAVAWAGMATLGWATSGHTQLGAGRQMPGGTRIDVRRTDDEPDVSTSSHLPSWFRSVRESPSPSAAANVRDMENLMSTARRWPKAAVADLSGGKDSRVVAAVGIRAGAVQAVRTIRTDHGEVETARRLMRAITTDVEHIIEPRRPVATRSDGFLARIDSQHEAWEGRYLATTAFNAVSFTGFRAAEQARFNGLGGECIAGGALAAGWETRLADAPAAAAVDRLASMARGARESAADVRQAVVEDLRHYVDFSAQLGVESAIGVLDVAYLLDRMPNWSNTFTAARTLCPLFAPSLLMVAAQTAGGARQIGRLHQELIAAAIPAWADVPFYKASGVRSRATAFVWQQTDWPVIRNYIQNHVEASAVYEPSAVATTMAEIEDGRGAKKQEVFIHRFLWDLRFETYVRKVAELARGTAHAVDRARRVGCQPPS